MNKRSLLMLLIGAASLLGGLAITRKPAQATDPITYCANVCHNEKGVPFAQCFSSCIREVSAQH